MRRGKSWLGNGKEKQQENGRGWRYFVSRNIARKENGK
jgi:hypothetical protein